jgi:hypothetical protein
MTAHDALRRILAAVSNGTNWQETVAPFLEVSLLKNGRIRPEYVGLRAFDLSSIVLSQPVVHGPRAKVVVSAETESLPYLAVLHRREDESWRLQSFEYQCPICFGTGVQGHHLNWEVCPPCGGTGWGNDEF